MFARCLALLEEQKASKLPPTDLEPILRRDDVKRALKDHNKTRSDKNDKKNTARAVLEGFQFSAMTIFYAKERKTYRELNWCHGI